MQEYVLDSRAKNFDTFFRKIESLYAPGMGGQRKTFDLTKKTKVEFFGHSLEVRAVALVGEGIPEAETRKQFGELLEKIKATRANSFNERISQITKLVEETKEQLDADSSYLEDTSSSVSETPATPTHRISTPLSAATPPQPNARRRAGSLFSVKNDKEKEEEKEEENTAPPVAAVVVVEEKTSENKQHPISVFSGLDKTKIFSLKDGVIFFDELDIEKIPAALHLLSEAARVSPRINDSKNIRLKLKGQPGTLVLTLDAERKLIDKTTWNTVNVGDIKRRTKNKVENILRRINKKIKVKVTSSAQDLSFEGHGKTLPIQPATDTDGESFLPATPTKSPSPPESANSPEFFEIQTPQKMDLANLPKENEIVLPNLLACDRKTLTTTKLDEYEQLYKALKAQRHANKAAVYQKRIDPLYANVIPNQLIVDLQIILKNKPWFLRFRKWIGNETAVNYCAAKDYLAEKRKAWVQKQENKKGTPKLKTLDKNKPLKSGLEIDPYIKKELSIGERQKYYSLIGKFIRSVSAKTTPDEKAVKRFTAEHNLAMKTIRTLRSNR